MASEPGVISRAACRPCSTQPAEAGPMVTSACLMWAKKDLAAARSVAAAACAMPVTPTASPQPPSIQQLCYDKYRGQMGVASRLARQVQESARHLLHFMHKAHRGCELLNPASGPLTWILQRLEGDLHIQRVLQQRASGGQHSDGKVCRHGQLVEPTVIVHLLAVQQPLQHLHCTLGLKADSVMGAVSFVDPAFAK